MPRTKVPTKKRAGGGSGGGRGPKKIIIRPFQKPPTLPPNYYEQTSRELLEGTVNVAFACDMTGGGQGQDQHNLSLQNSYQQVVNLTSHKYGPRLYRDLVETLQKTCQEHVLPTATLELKSSAEMNPNLLSYIQNQYQKYVDYLLLCKHVFLPLDRTHAWLPSTGEVVKRSCSSSSSSSSSGGGENTSSSSTNTTSTSQMNQTSGNNNINSRKRMTLMDLWQVGLLQFRRRLQDFQFDKLIYKKWWESLQMDWDDNLAGRGLDQQELLQTTLYMWQDLGVLGETLSQKLEPDLILFFQQKSQQLKHNSMGALPSTSTASTDMMVSSDTYNNGEYSAVAVISYCYSKWMHVAYNWSRFLPKKTCVKLLEDHLFRAHLHTDWLLNPKSFDPILEKAFAANPSSTANTTMPSIGSTTMSSSTTAVNSTSSTSLIQQLWMLAGRSSGGYKLVASAISQYARSRGAALMNAVGGDGPESGNNKSINSSAVAAKVGKQKIAELLELQKKLQQLLSYLPNSNEHCSLKHVWEDVINPTNEEHHEDTNMVAEALAKYVDACLKDSKRQLTTSTSSSSSFGNNSNWAESIISGVFCYLQAKDTFEAFYKQDLAKRLLWNRVVSMDVERHFVSLLKAECGAGYTSKMEGMFQDINFSRETMNLYKQTQYRHEKPPTDGSGDINNNYKLEMDIQVLTTGYWPVYPLYPNLILPQSLLDPQNKFTDYYKTKYQGRRMTWQYALGHVVVRFKPNDASSGSKYELLVSLCQALVLLQFNDTNELSLQQLMSAVGLEDRGEMERVLLSLSLGKEGTRVLQKRDHDAEKKKKIRMTVHNEDKFRVQSNFKSNTRRIRINNILMKETKNEREKTVKAVSRDRLYLIDAVLVRIMKARKTILHQQLIPQVMEQVKVPAQPADIKKRIESLIEREYFERDTTDRNRYNYLA
jgi:hypothetical protein